MADNNRQKKLARTARHRRVRSHLSGTAARPRLVVFRANRYTYGQIIDDAAGKTLASASTLEVKAKAANKTEAARDAGKLIAAKAKEQGIAAVVFDRGGYRYHGRVKAFAEGARDGGLTF